MSQELAIEAINNGESIFLHSAAGFGKSWVIEQTSNSGTVIGAQTSVAARNVGGATINSIFGIPFGIATQEEMDTISPKFREVFEGDAVTRIVLDEVSQLRADKLDLIDYKLRIVRDVDLPFGGIQIVLVGDLYQIPNIVERSERKIFRSMYRSPHVFNADVWEELDLRVIQLTEPKRNNNLDQVRLLQAIRIKDETVVAGKPLYQHAIDRVNQWARTDFNPSQLHLCCFVSDAKKRNREWYDKIEGREWAYKGERTGKYVGARTKVEDDMRLKVGTQILLCANNRERCFINGDVVTITDLGADYIIAEREDGSLIDVPKHIWEKVEYSRDEGGKLVKTVVGKFKQYPIKLGYAATIHSSQGLTLDSVTLDLGRGAFAAAMLYVAISRVRDLKEVALTRPVRYDDLIIDKKVVHWFKKLEQKHREKQEI